MAYYLIVSLDVRIKLSSDFVKWRRCVVELLAEFYSSVPSQFELFIWQGFSM